MLHINVFSPTLSNLGPVDVWETFDCVIRHNGAGTWSLKMAADHPHAAKFAEGNRIVVRLDDVATPILSGPMRKPEFAVEAGESSGTLNVSGIDDTARLGFRLIYPNPDSAIDLQTADAYYTDSGDAETVVLDLIDKNCGSSALDQRRFPHLVIPASEERGETVPVSARFDNLLDVAGSLATAGGIGFRIVQVGNQLQLLIDEPSEVKGRFSPKIGNLTDWGWALTAPQATRAIVAGQGEGTARTLIERGNADAESAWSERIEVFVDARDTDDLSVLQQRGDELLADAGGVGGLSQTAIDVPGMRFARNFNLGDLAVVDLGGFVITDRIRQVSISASATEFDVTPSVGDPNRSTGTSEIYEALRRYKRRIDKLERRQ